VSSSHFRCACGTELGPESLLDAATDYDAGMGTLATTCPRCGQGLTIQPRRGSVEVGYVYSSGSPHFEGLETVSARGLATEERDDDVLVIALGARRWEHALVPRAQWLWIRRRDHALGKTLDALQLEQTGVTVLALDANDGIDIPLGNRTPLTVRHRIRVHGTTGARRRAQERLATGR